MNIIGIQGGKGSFSEDAANIFTKNHGLEKVEIKYLISSEAVLSAVESEVTDYGIFAMENAQGGVVIESVKALAKYRCKIMEMFHISVDQNLLGLPGINIGDISEIHSHQQALRQCKDYLSEHFWTRPLIEEDEAPVLVGGFPPILSDIFFQFIFEGPYNFKSGSFFLIAKTITSAILSSSLAILYSAP